MKELVPYEEDEQKTFVEYLEAKRLMFTAIPNSTYTKSWKQKAKNKEQGLRPGLPDLIVLLPGKILFVEMKRRKGGRTTQEQKNWIAALNSICPHVKSTVCKGAAEAIALIEREYVY